MNRSISRFPAVAGALLAAACASLAPPSFPPGTAMSEVESRMGKPRERREGAGRRDRLAVSDRPGRPDDLHGRLRPGPAREERLPGAHARAVREDRARHDDPGRHPAAARAAGPDHDLQPDERGGLVVSLPGRRRATTASSTSTSTRRRAPCAAPSDQVDASCSTRSDTMDGTPTHDQHPFRPIEPARTSRFDPLASGRGRRIARRRVRFARPAVVSAGHFHVRGRVAHGQAAERREGAGRGRRLAVSDRPARPMDLHGRLRAGSARDERVPGAHGGTVCEDRARNHHPGRHPPAVRTARPDHVFQPDERGGLVVSVPDRGEQQLDLQRQLRREDAASCGAPARKPTRSSSRPSTTPGGK